MAGTRIARTGSPPRHAQTDPQAPRRGTSAAISSSEAQVTAPPCDDLLRCRSVSQITPTGSKRLTD